MPRPFQVRRSKIHGKGVFATRHIPKGTRLIEYRGERISWEEADRRYDDDIQPHHTFLFAVDDDVVIDAGVRGNDARWINHSCDPNCEAVDEDGRIFIETIRDIAPGEELTYDYSYILDEPHTAAVKARYPCHCGSPKCRGTILGNRRRFREQLAREERRLRAAKRKRAKRPARRTGGKRGAGGRKGAKRGAKRSAGTSKRLGKRSARAGKRPARRSARAAAKNGSSRRAAKRGARSRSRAARKG